MNNSIKRIIKCALMTWLKVFVGLLFFVGTIAIANSPSLITGDIRYLLYLFSMPTSVVFGLIGVHVCFKIDNLYWKARN